MTVRVALAAPLADHVGGRRNFDLEGETVEAVLRNLTTTHAGLAGLFWGENGTLNPLLVVFRNQDNVADLDGLATPVTEGDELAVISALEGG